MKTNEKLALWLGNKNRNYCDGVRLFTDLNIDAKQVGFFATEKPVKLHMNVLIRRLENYARVHGIKPVWNNSVSQLPVELPVPRVLLGAAKPVKPTIERPRIDSNPTVRKEELPEDLQLLFDENGMLNNELKTLHAELKVAARTNAGKDRVRWLSNRIVQLKNKMRENWHTIDTWWYKQKGKSAEQMAAEDAIRKKNRITANLNYIRRYNNSQKEGQKAELARRKQELDQWEISYEELVAKVAVSG